MNIVVFKVLGALGVLLISIGIATNKRSENILYLLGGICLLIYSFYIKDIIFIVLQIIFILSAGYALIKNKK